MMNTAEISAQISREDVTTLADKIKLMTIESIEKQAKLAAEEYKKKTDPAEAVIKAFVSMDKAMMKVMDEHIERVRASSERNKIHFRKQAIKKEIEKRAQTRKEYFDEAAEKAEAQRRLLRMKG